MSRSDKNRYVKVVITSGYNSALLGICGQYPVSKPQIIILHFQNDSIYSAKGYIQDGGKVYFKKTGETGEFYIGNASLSISLLAENIDVVRISEATSLPSDVVEVTVS